MAKEFFTGSATARSSDELSLADIVFESWDSFDSNNNDDVDEKNNNDDSICASEKCKAFWEEKDQLLKVRTIFFINDESLTKREYFHKILI